MRTAFITTLLEQAKRHPDLFLLTGDLGYSVVEPFRDSFPERFLNVGVAEQNMTGIAAGLASEGYQVFTYSIANFPTLRCLEQIRNDICHHQLSVTVVGVGAGLAYGALGYSHHAVQDLACMRGFPGMLLATPGDPLEAAAATAFLCRHRGPAYLRLGKAGEHVVHAAPPLLQLPGFLTVMPGGDRAVIACGTVLAMAAEPARRENTALISAVLWGDLPDVGQAVRDLVARHRRVVVVEEHLRAGGFGSFVRECLEPCPELNARVRCLALSPESSHVVGSQNFCRHQGGVTQEAIQAALN